VSKAEFCGYWWGFRNPRRIKDLGTNLEQLNPMEIHFYRIAFRWSCEDRASFALQSVVPGDYFEFAADGVFDADHGVHLEHKCRSIEQTL
jgi:hypothetical protein